VKTWTLWLWCGPRSNCQRLRAAGTLLKPVSAQSNITTFSSTTPHSHSDPSQHSIELHHLIHSYRNKRRKNVRESILRRPAAGRSSVPSASLWSSPRPAWLPTATAHVLPTRTSSTTAEAEEGSWMPHVVFGCDVLLLPL